MFLWLQPQQPLQWKKASQVRSATKNFLVVFFDIWGLRTVNSSPRVRMGADGNWALQYDSAITHSVLETLADSGFLRGRCKKRKKGTSVQKVIRHVTVFCPPEGHPRGHFTTFFLHREGTLEGTLPCFVQWKGTLEGTLPQFSTYKVP